MPAEGVSSNLPALKKAMAEQLKFTTQELGPYLENRAARFRYSLFQNFKRHKTPRARIDQEAADRAFAGRVGRYLFVSAWSVYDSGKLDIPLYSLFTEDAVDWSSMDYRYREGEGPYGTGKRHCEKWLREEAKLPCTIVRIPAMFGPDDPTGRMAWWLKRVLDGRGVVIPFEDRGPLAALSMEDAARAFMAASDAPAAEGQTYHVGLQETLTDVSWADLLSRFTGCPCPITYVPRAAIHRHPGLEEYRAPITIGFPYSADLFAARRDFGFATTPIEVWLKNTAAWYQENPPEDAKGYAHRDAEVALAERWRPAVAEPG